jgi:hypothetical protein
MIVACVAKRGETLPDDYLDPRVPRNRSTAFNLTQGKEYVVYAAATIGDQVWFYVVDDSNLWYPIRKPAPLFKIMDARISQYWRLRITPANKDHKLLLAFDEWVSNEWFYDRLSDKNEPEVEIFRHRKQQMDTEFAF